MRSRRLLRLAGDDRLVVQIQRGSEVAFEVAFERHLPAILAFCRHMLGSHEEAEDAAQHTFAAAYRDLERGAEREIALKPWLFTIARNRCLSVLRARRELPLDKVEVATAGLPDQVEQRAELRQLLADVRELPDEQRAALLLAEVGGLAQVEIASVLGCEAARVKALVYRARSALVARREAREVPCDEIREQLANLRGGSLRRTELRLHLRECSGCRDFREQMRRQRQMLSAALPVAPTLGLKASVLTAVGMGGGAAGGGAAGGGAAAAGGAAVAKYAAVAVIAAGGVAGGAAVVEHERHVAPNATPGSGVNERAHGAGRSDVGAAFGSGGRATLAVPRHKRSDKPAGRVMPSNERTKRPAHAGQGAPGRLKAEGGQGQRAKPEHAQTNRGRGPIVAPPKDTPVRRGPPEPKLKKRPARTVPEARTQKGPDRPGESDALEKPGSKLE